MYYLSTFTEIFQSNSYFKYIYKISNFKRQHRLVKNGTLAISCPFVLYVITHGHINIYSKRLFYVRYLIDNNNDISVFLYRIKLN